MDTGFVFILLLFVVSLLYASVGHGGASGYLALMALFQFSPDVMKPTALLLNIFVSFTSFVQFYRGKHFNLKIFYPLVIASVPMAFLGGLTHIDGALYKKILGILLLVPVIRFLIFPDPSLEPRQRSDFRISLLIGAGIGYLSGLIGIGGGILLSPILLFLRWTDQKQTAAISALFILINSLAGLMGQWMSGLSFSADMLSLILVTFAGGWLGAYLGSTRFPQRVLKFILALVLSLASYKLIFTTA